MHDTNNTRDSVAAAALDGAELSKHLTSAGQLRITSTRIYRAVSERLRDVEQRGRQEQLIMEGQSYSNCGSLTWDVGFLLPQKSIFMNQ